MLVRGSFRSFPRPPSVSRVADQPLFVALCTPTVDRLQSRHQPHFSSVHRLDMSFTQVSDRCGRMSELSDIQDVIPALGD